ncbi:hypothetical protein CBR_g84848 [Chara braunii]|uniref:Pyruvate kinase n=1 Tax=Chara braunii TaxID=69332 RepID=A0A388KAU3_CHABU|nr:hypothetical protein CBR_g84848 [Chara braunii]|eukprot:GBG67184.1 hypothetical protein CBR_g84848 [Chara braunii]
MLLCLWLQIIVDTPEPSLKVVNVANDQKIELFAGQTVTLTTDTSIPASTQFLPVNSPDLTKVEKVEGNSVICICNDNATLDGGRIMVNLAKYRSEMPSIFPQEEVEAELSRWDQPNLVDFVEISCIRTAADVIEMRSFLSKTRYMRDTKIIAKIESRQGLAHFNSILEEADGIMLSRGDLGLAIPIEKIVQAQKYIVRRCNLVAKPVIVTRVLDSMVNVPAPTRAEATDVANAVLDENVFNKEAYSKYLAKNLQSPMPNTLAVAASAVRAASKVKARLIICFTSTGKVPRLTASFRPNIPILSVVLPTLSVGNNLRWTASGAMQARQTLLSSGLIPILADPRGGPTNKHLHDAFQVGKKLGLVRPVPDVVG